MSKFIFHIFHIVLVILNWMLEGLKMYKKIGLKPPMEIQAAIRAYRAEMDVVEQWLQNNCLRGPQFDESISELGNSGMRYFPR